MNSHESHDLIHRLSDTGKLSEQIGSKIVSDVVVPDVASKRKGRPGWAMFQKTCRRNYTPPTS